MTKLEAYLKTFTDRERDVYDYLVKGFTQAVDDLKQLPQDAHNYQARSTRIDDRLNNFAYTLQVLGVHINYDPYNNFKITIELEK